MQAQQLEISAPRVILEQGWKTVCQLSDLVVGSGVCALGHNNQQIAIFCLPQTQGVESNIHAVSNYDPLGKAQVMYRGILGSVGAEPVIASPLFKQHFSLLDGRCFEQADVQLKVYPVRVQAQQVQLYL